MKKQKEKVEEEIKKVCRAIGTTVSSVQKLAIIEYLKRHYDIDIYKRSQEENI